MDGSAKLNAGIGFFNEGRYYDAHEVWEDLWRETPEPRRRFYQGLIQAAVGLYHLQNGNDRGARSQLAKAIRNLTSHAGDQEDVEGAALIEGLEEILSDLAPRPIRIIALK